MKKKNIKQKYERGFTLFLAMLVSSGVLLAAFGVFTVMIKEVRFSQMGTDSQIAFYAADAGVECALYWDWRRNKFGTFDETGKFAGGGVENALKCAGQTLAPIDGSLDADGKSDNIFSFGLGNNSCVEVEVAKEAGFGTGSKSGKPLVETMIVSNGYNSPCGSTQGTYAVERSLQVNYCQGEGCPN